MSIALLESMNKRIVTSTLLSACLALGAAGVPAALAAPAVVPQPATTDLSRTAGKSSSEQHRRAGDTQRDIERYAAAERAQPQAAEFEGGATLVIVGSTTAVVLGVLLLIVLL